MLFMYIPTKTDIKSLKAGSEAPTFSDIADSILCVNCLNYSL